MSTPTTRHPDTIAERISALPAGRVFTVPELVDLCGRAQSSVHKAVTKAITAGLVEQLPSVGNGVRGNPITYRRTGATT